MEYFNNTHLFRIFWKWRKLFIITMIIAGILGVIFSSSLFITPKYKSLAVIYPSNISPYSDENETEQMLQWLQSRDIKDSVIHRFNLANHYEIDSSYKYFYSTILWEYEKNVKISKTQYESIEITVLDKSPVIAKEMVEAIIELLNNKIKYIHQDKYREVVEISRNIMMMNKKELDSVNNILHSLAEDYGIYSIESQSRELMRGFLKTTDGTGSSVNNKNVESLKKAMGEKSAQYFVYANYVQHLLQRYNDSKRLYEEAYKNYTKNFTYTNIITKPYVADKKTYPVRWLIVLSVMFAAFILFIVVVSVIENKSTIFKMNKNS